MIRFMNRYGKLVYLLFNRRNGMSLIDIAEELNVAISTASRDLETLEEQLPLSWKLIRNEREGIRLEVPSEAKIEDAWQSVNESNMYFQIIQSIFEVSNLTTDTLTDEYHLSRATLFRKINEVRNWLETFNITLSSRPYYKVAGDERNIRAVMMQFYDVTFSSDLYEIESFNVDQFQRKLDESCLKQGLLLKLGSIRRITLYLHILYSRRGKIEQKKFNSLHLDHDFGKHSKMLTEIMEEIQESLPKHFADETELQLENELMKQVLYSESRPESKMREILKFRRDSQELDYQWIKSFLIEVSNRFFLHFSDDDHLVYNLIQFVQMVRNDEKFLTNSRPNYYMTYILTYRNHPLNVMIGEILKKYPLQYVNKKQYDEIDQLMLFLLIKSSIYRFRRKIESKVVLITRTYVERAFLTEILLEALPSPVEIRHIDFKQAIYSKLFSDFDLAVSTEIIEPNDIPHLPISIISAVPTEYELKYTVRRVRRILDNKLTDNVELIKYLDRDEE